MGRKLREELDFLCTCSVAHRKRTLSVELCIQEGVTFSLSKHPPLKETFKTYVSTILQT